MRSDRMKLLVLVAGLNVVLPLHASDCYVYRTVARTGDVVPGLGGVFTDLGQPRINGAGQVAFTGYRSGELGTRGMWYTPADDPEALELIALSETQVPGAPGGTTFGQFHYLFSNPEINEQGNIAFGAPITGNASPQLDGVFRMIDGEVTKVAIIGDAAPGTNDGVTFAGFAARIGFNDNNLAAFASTLAGAGVNDTNDNAVFMHWFGGLNLVKREGAVAPPPEFGWTWGSSGLWGVHIANDGRVVFNSGLHTQNGSQVSRWTGWPAALEHQMIAGNLSPLNHPFVNDYAVNLHVTTLTDGGMTFYHEIDVNGDIVDGLWDHDGQTIHTIAAEGFPGPLGTYLQIDSTFASGFNGTTAFRARFDLPDEDSDSALMRKQRGQPAEVLIRENDPAPGFWPGVVFDEFVGTYQTHTIDDTDRVYVQASVRGPGITETNDIGLWRTDPDGSIHMVIRDGQSFTLNDGIARQVEQGGFFFVNAGAGLQTGRRPGVNANGDVALRVFFDDGTVAIIVAEPPSCTPGDLNCDGVVDGADLALLLGAWGATDECGCAAGDLNSDCTVNGADLAILLGNWG